MQAFGDLDRFMLAYAEPLPQRSREQSMRNLSSRVEGLLAEGLTPHQVLSLEDISLATANESATDVENHLSDLELIQKEARAKGMEGTLAFKLRQKAITEFEHRLAAVTATVPGVQARRAS